MPYDRDKTVFISGSAYEYGRLGEEGKDFIRNLTRSLLRNDFRIITGFGIGVGNYVVESALDEIYAQPGNRLTDQLRIFPFPTFNDGIQQANGGTTNADLEDLHRKYREDIISLAGSAIFLFGNKLEDIAIREADGMRKEFEVARLHGTRVIPIGVSGYISAALWKDLVDHYDDYMPDRGIFDSYLHLGNPDAGQIAWIDAVLRIAHSTHG